MQAALNVRNAPVDMQFFGPGKRRIWCRTATETMHFWDWGGSIAQQAPDYMAVEEDPDAGADSCDMMDAREQLNASLKEDSGLFQGQVWLSCCCSKPEMFSFFSPLVLRMPALNSFQCRQWCALC